MNKTILFDAAVERIFGEYLDKDDIISETTALLTFLKKNENYQKNNREGVAIGEHVAFLDTILLAMQEKL